MEVILYSTHCPKCVIIEKKLKLNNISYTVIDDVDKMIKLGMLSAPYLQIEDFLLDFGQAVKYLNNLEKKE